MSRSGLRLVRDRRAAVREQVASAEAAGVRDAAEELLQAANQTVPKEEGVLEASGDVSVDQARRIAQVGYGGEAAAYAVRQHEDTTLSHDGGRRAKWLERAAKENAARLGLTISVGVRERLR